MNKILINFVNKNSENENKELIDIIKNYYYNNDLPNIKEIDKIKKWFELDTIMEIEDFLKNISDTDYDEMIEMTNLNTEVGSVSHNKKYKLSKYMGSLDKIKTETEYLNWKQKQFLNKSNEIVITEKLDGISSLLTINKKCTKLCTRGNGKVGCDISHILKYLKLEKQIKMY